MKRQTDAVRARRARARRDLRIGLAADPSGIRVTCAGRSMEPTVRLGESVRVRRQPRIRVGDVVLFEARDNDTLVLHRVIARVPGTPYFLHLGDAPTRARAGISRTERVLGTAELPRRVPSARAAVAALRALVRSGWRQARGRSSERFRL